MDARGYSGGGYVLMHRKIYSSPDMRGKEDIYAALWLVAHAAWRKVTVRVGGDRVDLDRGQLAYSVSYLAQAWECSKSTVHDRLAYFVEIGFIRMARPAERQPNDLPNDSRTTRRTRVSVVTICNYSKYQASEDLPERPAERQPNDPPNNIRTNKKELNTDSNSLRSLESSQGENVDEPDDPLVRLCWGDPIIGALCGDNQHSIEHVRTVMVGWLKKRPPETIIRYVEYAIEHDVVDKLKYVQSCLARHKERRSADIIPFNTGEGSGEGFESTASRLGYTPEQLEAAKHGA